MQENSRRFAGAILIALGALIAGTNAAIHAQEITLPEKILFQSKHFGNVKISTRLNYSFNEEEKGPDSFNDKVSIDILKCHADGTASVAAHFLSGAQEIHIPPIDHAQGNPVILGFLERDVAEMKRLTGGATGYFRKRIRLALAAPDVPVKKINVAYEGRQILAQEITIYPFLDDPLKDRLGKYVDKGYVFVTSDAIPGSLYRAYTTVMTEKGIHSVATAMAIE
ncbi:MAG: hypothetical protein ABIQ90_10920 [Polaromonas sp.]